MHYFKRLSLLLFSFLTLSSYAQNVGIGTSNPNSSAMLDISSTNRGLLMPRVADTSNVTTPAEGLMVYNRADKAPNYFDGNRWNNVADARNNFVPLEGTIKYSLTGVTSIGGMAVQTGLLDAIDYSNAFRAPRVASGPAQFKGIDSVIFEKEFDGNSIIFKRALLSGQLIPTLEILQYLPGASTAFYSIKITNARVLEHSFYISQKTGRLTEQYSLLTSLIGFRDLVNGKSFSYNVSTNTFGTY